jgi:hypothetical protein
MKLDIRLYTCYKDDRQFEFRDFKVILLEFISFGNKFVAALIYESHAPNRTKNSNG